ncbi:MAG: class I SAM-dependent methyltransferase, partial [Verrucomicrobiae bacterium]|nr:class I SAM-dependent methyltransferase [Verrucomicrobiae bacterium]
MKTRTLLRLDSLSRRIAILLWMSLEATGLAAPTGREAEAKQIAWMAGFHGGLVVHVGCGDGRLTAALRLAENCVVHGLDADAKNIEAARATIRTLGLYGPVSVMRWSGRRLPYVDNLV